MVTALAATGDAPELITAAGVTAIEAPDAAGNPCRAGAPPMPLAGRQPAPAPGGTGREGSWQQM